MFLGSHDALATPVGNKLSQLGLANTYVLHKERYAVERTPHGALLPFLSVATAVLRASGLVSTTALQYGAAAALAGRLLQ